MQPNLYKSDNFKGDLCKFVLPGHILLFFLVILNLHTIAFGFVEKFEDKAKNHLAKQQDKSSTIILFCSSEFCRNGLHQHPYQDGFKNKHYIY